MNRGMIALVTGASGFIGSTLIEELSRSGLEARALMRKTSSPKNLQGLRYTQVEGSLEDLDSLKKAVEGVDYVFHLAGTLHARTLAEFLAINAEGTRKLAEAVAERNPGLKRFVYVSSLAAAGPSPTRSPLEGGESPQPVSAYGQSKLEGEIELLKFKSRFPVSIIRPPIVYGPRDKDVFLFVQNVSRGLMPLLPGAPEDGHKYYSAVHVRDLVRGILQAAEVPAERVPSGEVFYLTGDEILTMEQIMKTIAAKLGKRPLRIRVPKPALYLAAAGASAFGKLTGRTTLLTLDKLNELLPNYWICSNEKAKRELGFKPEYDFATGMSDAIDWYKREKWI